LLYKLLKCPSSHASRAREFSSLAPPASSEKCYSKRYCTPWGASTRYMSSSEPSRALTCTRDSRKRSSAVFALTAYATSTRASSTISFRAKFNQCIGMLMQPGRPFKVRVRLLQVGADRNYRKLSHHNQLRGQHRFQRQNRSSN